MDSLTIILDDIPFHPDIQHLCDKLRVGRGSVLAEQLGQLAADAKQHAKPKAIARLGFVETRGDDYIVVEGIKFTSRVLAVNLDEVQRIFAYVATCGHELDNWSAEIKDPLALYMAEAVKEHALHVANEAVKREIDLRFNPGTTSSMHPGSLQHWPLDEQGQLFSLLGNPEETIGVKLTPHFMMIPIKSISGIMYASRVDFSSCQLCPRKVCDARRAPYDPALFERRYSQGV